MADDFSNMDDTPLQSTSRRRPGCCRAANGGRRPYLHQSTHRYPPPYNIDARQNGRRRQHGRPTTHTFVTPNTVTWDTLSLPPTPSLPPSWATCSTESLPPPKQFFNFAPKGVGRYAGVGDDVTSGLEPPINTVLKFNDKTDGKPIREFVGLRNFVFKRSGVLSFTV